ncbi:MAG TPA: hypothetical protein VHX52_14425 [Steroidobacteraceae bacterium]|jgi:hypothetical protein|nr:hypothetical protein [Steroidobacteraceae bacterium]
MSLLARVRGKSAPAAPAQATAEAPHDVVRALNAVLSACRASDLDQTCSTIQTVEDLLAEIGAVKIDGSVTLAALDKAIDELASIKVPASGMRALQDLRSSLAQAEAQAAAEAAASARELVTQGEFDAFRTAVALVLRELQVAVRNPNYGVSAPTSRGLTTTDQVALEDLLDRISRAGKIGACKPRERYIGQPWSTM